MRDDCDDDAVLTRRENAVRARKENPISPIDFVFPTLFPRLTAVDSQGIITITFHRQSTKQRKSRQRRIDPHLPLLSPCPNTRPRSPTDPFPSSHLLAIPIEHLLRSYVRIALDNSFDLRPEPLPTRWGMLGGEDEVAEVRWGEVRGRREGRIRVMKSLLAKLHDQHCA